MKKRTAFRIVALLLGVLSIVAGVELFANVYLYVRDGRYVSARTRLDALSNSFIISSRVAHQAG